MFTVARLEIPVRLRRTLTNTNCIESMISINRTTTDRVKNWTDGTMKKRWIAAGMLEAKRSFGRIKGHADMPAFIAAVHRATNPDTPVNYADVAGQDRDHHRASTGNETSSGHERARTYIARRASSESLGLDFDAPIKVG
jgi:hypothetical protein